MSPTKRAPIIGHVTGYASDESDIPDEDMSGNNLTSYINAPIDNNATQNIDQLESEFEMLHGQGYTRQLSDAGKIVDPAVLQVRKRINSHDFKYSAIPFSRYNNSLEVNLYAAKSRIPYLFSDPVFPGDRGAPSLFFKCYSDDIYEAILEDLRNHYIAISNQDMDEDNEYESAGMEVDNNF